MSESIDLVEQQPVPIEFKLGAFYTVKTKTNVIFLVRPFMFGSDKKSAYYYLVVHESISSGTLPFEQFSFVKEASKEELVQFRRIVNDLYRDRYGVSFIGKFYLDDSSVTKSNAELKSSIDQYGGNKQAKKKLKEQLHILKQSKIEADQRRKTVLDSIATSTIESERDNLKIQLKEIKEHKKKMKAQIKSIQEQVKAL